MKKYAAVIIWLWLAAVLIGSLLQLDPDHIRLDAILQSPNAQYWLGADDLEDLLPARGVEDGRGRGGGGGFLRAAWSGLARRRRVGR